MVFILWFTGLPGSGKSTIAREAVKLLKKRGVHAEYVQLDAIRKSIVSKPEYTEKERDRVYRALGEHALALLGKGKNVVVDATAHRKKYRDYVRKRAQRFVEVYVRCPLEVCVERETKRTKSLVIKKLYAKALERKKSGMKNRNVGQVIGIDVPYEENATAEIVIDSETIGPNRAALKVLELLGGSGVV
jgi:adenylylsulfate kinase